MFSERKMPSSTYTPAKKYMADIRPDRLTTCHSEQKSVVSRPSVQYLFKIQNQNFSYSDMFHCSHGEYCEYQT
jgi:hypothetical protein